MVGTAPHRNRRWRLAVALVRTLTVYLFAIWVYVAAIAVFHPNALNQPIWHGIDIRRDSFGAACFLGSLICFVVRRLISDGSEPRP